MKKIIAILLAVTFLITGCMARQPLVTTTAMGRYVEEVIPLPDGVDRIKHLDVSPEGTIQLVTSNFSEEVFRYWRYGEAGWTEQSAPWLEDLKAMEMDFVEDFSLAADGTPYCIYRPIKEPGAEGIYAQPVLAVYENGAWRDTGVDVVYHDIAPENFKVLDDKTFAAGYYSKLIVFDKSGEIIEEYASENRMYTGFYTAMNGLFAVSEPNSLKFYDRQTGDVSYEIPIQYSDVGQGTAYGAVNKSQTAFCWAEDGAAICYVNQSGIYQTTVNGQVTEKVLDGTLTSLVMPSVNIMGLTVCPDGSFLVEAVDDDYKPLLFRYRYDESVPTVPATELRIYSVYDSPTIRQAMGSFQRDNPDVAVRYEVGVPENSSITYQDAVRTLSTEILSGNGPDLLVLDDLPIDDYLEKDVLADLGELDGEFFENVTGIFRSGGATYAVPAVFQLPVLLAEEDIISQVQTPAELVAYLQAQPNPRIGDYSGERFGELAKHYYSRWYAGGMLNPQAFAEDLEAFLQLEELLGEIEPAHGYGNWDDLVTAGLIWKENAINLRITTMYALSDMRGPYTAFREREGALTLYPQQQSAYFPTVIMGVNAAGRQPELARRFIGCVLSKEQQVYELGEGLPVNRAAFEEIFDTTFEPGAQSGSWGLGKFNPETGEMESFIADTYWPDAQSRRQLIDLIEAARTPVVADKIVMDILLEEGERCLRGDCTPEEAARSAEQKISLRSLE